jgi:hypothetical protein
MIAAAVYFLLADAVAEPPPDAWLLVAYLIWIIGLNMLVSLMN